MNNTKQEYAQFTKRLFVTAEVFGRELSDLGVAAFFNALIDLSLEDISDALGVIERESKFWPTPALIRAVVECDGSSRALLPPEEQKRLREQDQTARAIGYENNADMVERNAAGIGSHDPWPKGHPQALPKQDPPEALPA